MLSEELDYKHNTIFFKEYKNFIENIESELISYLKGYSLSFESVGINTDIKKLNSINWLNNSIDLYSDYQALIKNVESYKNNQNAFSIGDLYLTDLGKKLSHIIEIHKKSLGENFEQQLKKREYKKIYIPILRGMKPLRFESDEIIDQDVYRDRIIKDYFEKPNVYKNIDIFTGIQLNTVIRDHLLGTLRQRQLINEYQIYLCKNFFNKKPVTLIPSLSNGIVRVKVGDEEERPIHAVGDGIQSIIILTLPLFLNKGKNLLVFIEEPELLLHPGLQRKLIEIFNSNEGGFENYQYFMTTHSNHFLDITSDFSDVSIYTLRKKLDDGTHEEKDSHFEIENLSHGDRSALELLGVRNSSVFLSNCTIWVEGITDRLYFRHYLEKYVEHLKGEDNDFVEFKEDYHYSFVEYGGGNITHLSFLDKEDHPINVERLCGRLFLIVDKDKNKDERHNELEKKLGVRFCRLECKEVENLLSKKVLMDVITDYEKGKPKIEDFEEAEYKDVYLGEFIDTKLIESRRKTYADESGTIRDKLRFSVKARDHIKEWDDLSEEAKDICKRIYQFIKDNN